MINLKVEPVSLESLKTEALAVFMFEDDKDDSSYRTIDKKLGGRISILIKKKKFVPKKFATRAIDTLGKLKADTVLLVGLGKKGDFTTEIIRRAAAKAASSAASADAKNLGLSVEQLASRENSIGELSHAAAEGITLSQYSFNAYRKKETKKNSADKPSLSQAVFAQKKNITKVKMAISAAQKVCQGVFLARDLQNHPANVATPTYIAEQARKFCRKVGVRCKILGKREIQRLKMGAFWAVAKGSAQEPKFLIMEYMKGSGKPVVLVGKGITFDSGGISIKSSHGMEEMKFDMSGGAAVIGTMIAASLLKLKRNIVGLVPLTENMPGGKANKPGDIIRASDGKTIEVLNTDAEGRLVLADALVYAKKYNPSKVIDLATLTGAIMVSLANYATGLFCNDQKLADAILESGKRTGERCWQFPLWEEYEEMIKSKVADIKNTGGRWGGSITAAAFLKQFADYPWVHLDIAGTADNAKPTAPYNTPGGTGIGVRLLIDFLQTNR